MKYKRIKDIFNNFKTDTYFFPKLIELTELNIDAVTLSQYYFPQSLNRIVSPFCDFTSEYENSNNIFANILSAKYKKKWNQAMTVIRTEYDPTYNYDMTEQSTDTHKGTVTGNSEEVGNKTDTNTNSSNSTTTYGKIDDLTRSGTLKEDNSSSNSSNKYGMNTNTAHPDTTGSGTSNTTTTDTRGEKNTSSGNDKNEYSETNKLVSDSTNTHDSTETTDMTDTHTLSRKGNIGVTTTQQMIQSDLELWQWIFLDTVIQDINNTLTLSIY